MIAGEDSNQLSSIQMDFTARRFDSFSETFTISYYDDNQILQEVDLTGAIVQMQLKKRKSDSTAVLNMDVAISGNEITISKPHSLMDLPKGKYWYDLEVLNSDSEHITWVHGRFTVVEHVTKWVEVHLANLYTKIETFFEMPDVPKTVFGYVLQSILKITTQIIYGFKAIITATLSFSTLKSIVLNYKSKQKITQEDNTILEEDMGYLGIFKVILDIIQVPKAILHTIFSCAVVFIGTVYFYGSAPFKMSVFFYDDEPPDPYQV